MDIELIKRHGVKADFAQASDGADGAGQNEPPPQPQRPDAAPFVRPKGFKPERPRVVTIPQGIAP